LQEIDENLIRYELHFIDRGNHLKRRKEIYEELNPETKHGVVGGLAGGRGRSKIATEIISVAKKPSFSKDTSNKIGVTERTIRQEIQIVTNIVPEVQEFIKEQDFK